MPRVQVAGPKRPGWSDRTELLAVLGLVAAALSGAAIYAVLEWTDLIPSRGPSRDCSLRGTFDAR